MRLIDTHCHIHTANKFPDPARTLLAAQEANVETVIVVGVNPEDWPIALAFAERWDGEYTEVKAILGWHPNNCQDYSSDSLEDLRSLLAHPKCQLMGEIGLDFHWNFASAEMQYRALSEQLDLADSLSLPTVFHCREAVTPLLDTLSKRSNPPDSRLIHCFSGTVAEAERAFEMGILIGMDGPVTYPKSIELRDVLAVAPRHMVVTETDSPYLTPAPYRGKSNQPSYVQFVLRTIAEVWGESEEVTAETVRTNAHRFFRL